VTKLPFDGVVTKCIVNELTEILVGGRIEKIFQPERDEILINIRSLGQNLKLVISASANYPRIHLTQISKENPSVPPVFCMLLRKHLASGKITGIDFHDFERIVTLRIESTNEMGDTSEKKLIVEIMGRHSNIILTNSESKIIDSIKHVDNEISSVREVMPAREYVLPPSQNKPSLDQLDVEELIKPILLNSQEAISPDILISKMSISKYLLNSIKGFSPLLCNEICFRSGINEKIQISELNGTSIILLKKEVLGIFEEIRKSEFSPCIIYDVKSENLPIDFHSIKMHQFTTAKYMTSISDTLDTFYSKKDWAERLKQKKADLSKVLNNSLDRCNKKLSLQQDKLREVSTRENLKLFGELITANIYCIPQGVKTVMLSNYYSENNASIEIPLDENLSPQQNAQKYYKQYSKAKTAFAFTSQQMELNLKELEYLESVQHLLENCVSMQEIDEVRQELAEQGYITVKTKGTSKKKQKSLSAPLHFISEDGLDIFVGKNNKQNDLLTLKLASSNDTWLHTRNIPGSHVIIRKLISTIPDRTLLEAATLSAFYSKARFSSNVAVDYTTVKNVKKPSGAKPGMVIYNDFKTIIVTPDEAFINKLKTDK
jgi:predicted ribosome quality control (RQC) complex YloA/Tae2 family protein